MPSAPRRLALACCLLSLALCALALVPPALSQGPGDGTAAASEPQATEGLALPERVVLDGPARHDSARIQPDVAAAVDSGGTELDGAYEHALLEAELDAADDQAERRAVLDDWSRRLDDTLRSVTERERAARSSYRAEDRDARSLLWDIGAVNDRVVEIERVADTVEAESERAGADNVTRRIDAIRGDLAIRQGPVRTHVTEIAAGDRPASRFHVSASANGTVIATIDEDGYHREATRDDLLLARGTSGAPWERISTVVPEELYPVHHDNYGFDSGAGTVVLFQLYEVIAESPTSHPHGTLRSYVDGVSENVFWEYQRMELDEDLPTGSTHTAVENDTTVAVERTYPSGPARVTVSQSGERVDGATIEVDGVPVAESEGGLAWIVLPEDASTIDVTTDDGSVQSDVSW